MEGTIGRYHLPIENDVFPPFQRLIYLEQSITFSINFYI